MKDMKDKGYSGYGNSSQFLIDNDNLGNNFVDSFLRFLNKVLRIKKTLKNEN